MTPTAGTSYTPLSNGRELLSHPLQPGICLFLNMSPYLQISDFNLWTWTPEPWKVSTVSIQVQVQVSYGTEAGSGQDLFWHNSSISTWKELEMGAVAEAVVLAVALIFLGKTFSEKNCNLGLWQKQQGGGDHLEALGNSSNPFHCVAECRKKVAECRKKGRRWWHLAACVVCCCASTSFFPLSSQTFGAHDPHSIHRVALHSLFSWSWLRNLLHCFTVLSRFLLETLLPHFLSISVSLCRQSQCFWRFWWSWGSWWFCWSWWSWWAWWSWSSFTFCQSQLLWVFRL